MSQWAVKRFWTKATVDPAEAGFEVRLDGRRVKTPAKAALILPTRSMAEAIAAEWQAQGEQIRPDTMPMTRSANAALDKVRLQHAEVAEMIAAYGDSDLLCYRAERPQSLVARQAEDWDPLLEWAADALNAHLKPVVGVIHVPQSSAALRTLGDRVIALDDFALTALHDLVSLSGSLIIGLAATEQFLPPTELWRRSRVDETWQEEAWGSDEEASETAERKRQAFLHAERFFRMAQCGD